MDSPPSTQCLTDVEQVIAVSVRLIGAIESLVQKLDELIESQFEECPDAQS